MNGRERAKQAAGEAAADLAETGMIVGLGTGSTARFAIERLGERYANGELRIQCVSTSEESADLARTLGLPVIGLEGLEAVDLTIDGADEIDAHFQMIKGGGGALLREKIVASLTRHQVIIVDSGKLVDVLGRFPLPVEVIPFGWSVVAGKIRALGGEPRRRVLKDGSPYFTDNGNCILDCRFFPIDAPRALEMKLLAIPGVLEVGLFVNLAHTLIIGREDGSVEVRRREERRGGGA